jgi:hypothetical protein
LLDRLGLRHRPTLSKNHLRPALAGGWIETAQPQSRNSPARQYRLTAKGRLAARLGLSQKRQSRRGKQESYQPKPFPVR